MLASLKEEKAKESFHVPEGRLTADQPSRNKTSSPKESVAWQNRGGEGEPSEESGPSPLVFSVGGPGRLPFPKNCKYSLLTSYWELELGLLGTAIC